MIKCYRLLCFICPPEGAGYAVNSGKKTKKKLAAPDISLTLDRSEGSLLSDELDESTELDLDDIDTPSDNSNEFEWEGINWNLTPAGNIILQHSPPFCVELAGCL